MGYGIKEMGYFCLQSPGSRSICEGWLRQRKCDQAVLTNRLITCLHQLRGAIAVLDGHGGGTLAERGVDEQVIFGHVPPLLLEGHVEAVERLDLIAHAGTEPGALQLLGDDRLMCAVDLHPFVGEEPGGVSNAGHRRDDAAVEAEQHDERGCFSSPRLCFICAS